MSPGVAWSLLAALAFGFTQTLNRKSNLLVGPYRTSFGLLVFVELLLVIRTTVSGDFAILATARLEYLWFFIGSGLIHFMLAWTLLAMSQNQIGVARTGAVTSAAPLVGAGLAAVFLSEPLTAWTLVGVASSAFGVALVSMSRVPEKGGSRWILPTFGLAVAACWGISPMLIRKGLEGIDAPVLGLTVGLGVALVVHATALTVTGVWRREPFDRRSLLWMALGGITGAVAISSQWIAYGATTIAIAITVQQLATLVVVALAPIMFGTSERPNFLLLSGTGAMLGGSALVVWAGG